MFGHVSDEHSLVQTREIAIVASISLRARVPMRNHVLFQQDSHGVAFVALIALKRFQLKVEFPNVATYTGYG